MDTTVCSKSIFVVLVCLLGMLGCRGIDSDDDDDDGAIGDGQGEVEVWITDGPVEDADAVDIAITGIEFKPVGEDPIEVLRDEVLIEDLLDLGSEDDPREEIISSQSLPVGDYQWIRLLLDETRLFIEVEGQQHPLNIPDEEEDGLQLEFNVQIEDDTDLDLTIDFDLRKSLRDLGDNDYELHPSLRLVRTSQAGRLSGTVAADLLDNDDCRNGALHREGNAVYIFSGGDAAFQDLQGNAGDPIATTTVEYSVSDGYEFTVGFLRRGSYTAVLTCDASVDDPEADNELGMLFSDPVNVTIEPESTTTIEFSAAAGF